MSTLLISNNGRNVIIKIDAIRLQYLGPKNLIKFININKVSNGCIYVNTLFKDEETEYEEEDFIDLTAILSEFNYNADRILNNIDKYLVQEVIDWISTKLSQN